MASIEKTFFLLVSINVPASLPVVPKEGTITTPFDMRVQNHIDRYHLVIDALKYLPQLEDKSGSLNQWCRNKLVEHNEYIREYGIDMPDVREWIWKDIS